MPDASKALFSVFVWACVVMLLLRLASDNLFVRGWLLVPALMVVGLGVHMIDKTQDLTMGVLIVIVGLGCCLMVIRHIINTWDD